MTPTPPPTNPTLPTIASKPAYLKAVTYSGVTVLQGTATWCKKCEAIVPEVAKMADEFPRVRFFTYDVDAVADVAHELGAEEGVPVFSVFRDGEYVGSVKGAKVEEVRRVVGESL